MVIPKNLSKKMETRILPQLVEVIHPCIKNSALIFYECYLTARRYPLCISYK